MFKWCLSLDVFEHWTKGALSRTDTETRVENSAFECVRETVTIITLYIVQHTEALLD